MTTISKRNKELLDASGYILSSPKEIKVQCRIDRFSLAGHCISHTREERDSSCFQRNIDRLGTSMTKIGCKSESARCKIRVAANREKETEQEVITREIKLGHFGVIAAGVGGSEIDSPKRKESHV